jgi:DNA polymerase (family X)
MSVSNRKIAKLFKLGASLLELHDDNSFKSRAYENAAFTVRQIEAPLSEMTEAQLESFTGIGKNLAKKIVQISRTGSYEELDRLQELTPPGLLELIRIKGIGAKKTKILWEQTGITSPETLLEACKANKLVDVKGFGKKTQENYIELIHFYFESKNKYLFAEAEAEMLEIQKHLARNSAVDKVVYTGEMRRNLPVITKIEFLLQLRPGHVPDEVLKQNEDAVSIHEDGYRSAYLDIPVYFYEVKQGENWFEALMRTTGSEEHLNLLKQVPAEGVESEEDIYKANNLPYIIPEMREGRDEFESMKDISPKDIISLNNIKGCLHNHSTYSDGGKTVEEMALYCKGMGLQYFGICDHSQTAVYAGGMKPFKVKEQWKEVDRLNQQLAPFKIFKGIESDILSDGSLDYDESLLKGFDFVVASVHSGLKMKEQDANKRLLKAIENPYTTILGHMTARLLLLRAAFPVDHKLIIDACVANNVVIEINSDPRRLDMDWKWYSYAMKKGILFSINPDAHETTEMHNMYFGVCVARKGGITNNRVLNTFTLSEVESYFNSKKSSAP